MSGRNTEARLWRLIEHLHEIHDAATKRRVRKGRCEYLLAVRAVLDLIDDERRRRS